MREGKDYTLPDRRFEISKDPFSQERKEALVNAYKELRRAFPGVHFGLSLYGSLSKGKKLNTELAKGADVDLCCYVDVEDSLREREHILVSNEAFTEAFQKNRRSMSASSAVPEENIYLETMLQVAEKTLTSALDTTRVQGSYATNQIRTYPIALEGPYSLLERLRSSMGHPDRMFIMADAFHLDVGGGLKRYRQDFLLKLSRMRPEEGAGYWKAVDMSARVSERLDRGIPLRAEKQFPHTLQAAIDYYGLPKEQTP